MATIPEEIGAIVSSLPPDKQADVLKYVRQLAQPTSTLPPGTPLKALLAFRPTISPEAVDEMEKAIEEGCERIELDDADQLSF